MVGAVVLRRRPPVSVALMTVIGVVVVVFARWGVDWPAQEFRAWIAVHDGLSLFTTQWYAGAALPGYSVLYPVLASVLDPGVLGVAAAAAITWVASTLVSGRSTARQLVFGLAVVATTSLSLVVGEIPFLVGSAFAVAGFTAVLRGHRRTALAGAVLASLTSPLVGLFVLAVVTPAVAVHLGRRRAWPLLGAAGGVLTGATLGGAGGPFPDPWTTMLAAVLVGATVVAFAGRRRPALATFGWCYLALAAVAFVVPNPIGGNVTRFGVELAAPLAAYYLPMSGRRERRTGVAVGLVAFAWPIVALVSSLVTSAGDPSRTDRFYNGLVDYLHRQGPLSGRIEIPFTRAHWEAYFVARQFPIARGWERQADMSQNAVLYQPLTASGYEAWLRANAVSYVALAHAPSDPGGQAEGALLRHAPAYLVPAWSNADWTVWRVADATPLVSGPARLLDQDQSDLTLNFTRPGTAVVRIHASPLWQSSTAGTCVGATADGWLQVYAGQAGPVELTARLSPALLGASPGCPA